MNQNLDMVDLTTDNLQRIAPRTLLRKGSFAANVLTLAAGTVLAQLVSAVGTLVLVRVFSPQDFGVLALFVALTSLVSVVSSLRYETAIVIPEKHEDAANLQVLALLFLSTTCFVSLIGVALFRYPIVRLLGEQELVPWLWGLPVGLFMSGLYQVLNYWCTRRKQFSRMATAAFGLSVATIGCQLGMFALGLKGPVALILGWIAGQAVGSLILALSVLKEDGQFLKRSFNWAAVRSGFFKYKNFPIYKVPHTFIQTAAQQLLIVVLRLLANIQVVGLFSVARRAVYLPVSLLGSSMQQVFYEKSATELKLGRLEPFVLRILKLQVMIGAPFLILFVFEAKLLFRVVLGNVWAEVGAYAALLAFAAYADFVTGWMNKIFDVQGQQKVNLIWEISRDIVVVGGLAAALVWSGNTLLSVGVFAGLNFLWTVMWLLVVFRIANFAVRSLWPVAGMLVGTGGTTAFTLWAVHLLLPPVWALILSSLLVMVAEGFIFAKWARASST